MTCTRLRTLRRKRGMTLETLATRAGLSKTHVWQLERDGNPSIVTLQVLAVALDVTVDYLISGGDLGEAEDQAFWRHYLRQPPAVRAQIRALADIVGAS